MGFLFENGLQISLELGNKYNNHNNPCALKWTSLNIGNHVQLSRSHKSPSLFSVAFCIHCKVWTAVVRGALLLVGFQVLYLACLTALHMGVRMGCLHSTALSFNSIEKRSRTSQSALNFSPRNFPLVYISI
jgi:hypothetical protein